MEYRPVLALPDVDLVGEHGKRVNPRDFAGHELVVLFCPADHDDAVSELAEYNALADALSYKDGYLVAVCGPGTGLPASRVTIATDPQRQAWSAFSKSLASDEQTCPEGGATFLMGRGGCLKQSWQGAGHAADVRRALGERM